MENCIGMTIAEFEEAYPGQEYRIERVDGEPRNLDANYDPSRLNLTIEDGVIVSFDWF